MAGRLRHAQDDPPTLESVSRSLRGTVLARVPLVALLPLLASSGCGSSVSEPTKSTPTPPANPAVRVVIVTSPKTTGTPWDVVGTFSVRVEDAEGRGVRGVHVRFRSSVGGDRGSAFGPSDTTSTDSTGVAWAGVKLGTLAGPEVLSATAQGVLAPALVNVVVSPGPAMWLRFTPEDPYLRLFEAGDSASFQAFAIDGWNNVIPNLPLDLRVSDPTLISVTAPPTQGANGWVHALRGGGTGFITSAAVQQSLRVTVTVFSKPRDACAGVATPQDLPIGVVTTVTDSTLCVAAGPGGREYWLMMYNGSTDGETSVGTTVTAYNVEAPFTAARPPEEARSSFSSVSTLSRTATMLRRSSAPKQDLRFHERLLERSRPLRRLFATARSVRSGGTTRARGARLSYSLVGGGSTVPAVGDLVALNVAEEGCSNADMRTFRVEAVGEKSIVLADTANPTGGFDRTDYKRFGARFDALVYPLDVRNFGEPSDIDGNGRVAILFTRAVNELTPANSGSYVGGFFHPRDLFPRTQSSADVCATSNEGELVYMMVPDPAGVVHGNVFSRGMVDTLTTGVLAHELQHLINGSRRLYVNSVESFEETWLNEGLSHIAEELLYFQESGYAPRSGLKAQRIIDTWEHFAPWIADDASNFVRFYLYLLDPANHSPIVLNDDLETRGATWAFLRYAVDRSYSSDGGVWQRFGNSTTTGLGTLAFGLQRDPKPLMRDFALANMTGDHPSWDFGSVFTEVFVDGIYPLPFTALKDATAIPVAANGGSASYYKFSIPADAQALLKFGSSAAPRNGNLSFMVLRKF